MTNISDQTTTVAPNPLRDSLKEFRKQIDACIQEADSIGKILPSRERTEEMESMGVKPAPIGNRELEQTRIKLQEAKMWVGKILEAIGSELPEAFRDKAEKKEVI